MTTTMEKEPFPLLSSSQYVRAHKIIYIKICISGLLFLKILTVLRASKMHFIGSSILKVYLLYLVSKEKSCNIV